MTSLRSVTDGGLFTDGRRLLRAALRIDAVITGVNGLAYLALAGPLESLLGLPTGPGRAIGALLLVYAVAVWAVSMPDRIGRGAAMAVVEANLLWTVLSIVAVATGRPELNVAGGVWAVLQALVVAGFAALQYTALRQTR
ncbi:hypothetical protein SAMN04489712_12839 [Thermomonospora echinospora]|uniref:Integral membrane protein n=1 Tax=Thermomonospora echinospora TaxID=1992 RepID=A0A1H6E122_9ACTN|nr:hypothetical protein [Thermomonospora echinospora]SEG91111.1 hypothetical protein SAMN04489712_12839 [Thermomonospora echinospora]